MKNRYMVQSDHKEVLSISTVIGGGLTSRSVHNVHSYPSGKSFNKKIDTSLDNTWNTNKLSSYKHQKKMEPVVSDVESFTVFYMGSNRAKLEEKEFKGALIRAKMYASRYQDKSSKVIIIKDRFGVIVARKENNKWLKL